MNSIGFSLTGFVILMVVFYVWGLLSTYLNSSKYKKFWLFVAPLLIIAPIYLFAISPFFLKNKDVNKRLKAILFFSFFTLSYYLFYLFFTRGMHADFSMEISLFSSSLSALLFLLHVNVLEHKLNK